MTALDRELAPIIREFTGGQDYILAEKIQLDLRRYALLTREEIQSQLRACIRAAEGQIKVMEFSQCKN